MSLNLLDGCAIETICSMHEQLTLLRDLYKGFFCENFILIWLKFPIEVWSWRGEREE